MITTAAAWLSCLAAVSTISTGVRAADGVADGEQQHLAVIVPAYRGDLQRAVASLERWPTICSSLTQANVDLVLYYGEGDEDAQEVDEAAEKISESAGRCFANTRTVYASLDEQDDFYPKGPSVQFYKMFLDDDVRAQLAEYDALAIIEWDVLVAADNSFEELYKAAFEGGGDFWVKGSNLGGTNFHTTAKEQEMWHVLGHINGNAIYNNKDLAFVEYVEYTRARWQYEHPYDVALWLTISDFPYSWPLWQRYSSKFVTTNLISSVGGEHVDSSSVSDAVAGHTLFIHGSRVDEGNIASRKAALEETNKRRPYSATNRDRQRQRKRSRRGLRTTVPEDVIEPAVCTSACGSEEVTSSLPDGTSTVCDASCGNGSGDPEIDDFLCDAGDADKYGPKCRICFEDEEEARRLQHVLAQTLNEPLLQQKIIMCDTMKPPTTGCSSECLSNGFTVCDDSCGTGRYGDYDCNWKDGGDKCRFCFNDVEAALAADEIAKREGGRVIMCSTMEPPQVGVETPELPGNDVQELPVLDASEGELADHPRISRNLQKWRETEKWKDLEKWKFDGIQLPEPPGEEECLDECTRNYSNGITGRVCDPSCAAGQGENGFTGCRAKDGIFGTLCRDCYADEVAAFEADDVENNERAILCATVEPVSIYDLPTSRRLAAEDPASAISIGRSFQDNTKIRSDEASSPVTVTNLENGPNSDAKAATTKINDLFAELSHQPFTEDITRGEICAFIAGREDEEAKWEVTVRSILQFVPGMRIAIAVEGDAQAYRRAVGDFSGVTVRRTPSAFLAGLNADKHCGPGTRLIFYVEADSILSRTFTAKDTHSPNGELLVVYSEPRTRDAVELSILSNSVLGFRPPSFTQDADLILPVEANTALRGLILSKFGMEEAAPGEAAALLESMGGFGEIAALPQILAALEYSKKAPGVWFSNPQAWVAEHLFKPVSIWEIPLVKPRFACALPTNARLTDPAEVLQENLDFFSHGGKCESGVIAVD